MYCEMVFCFLYNEYFFNSIVYKKLVENLHNNTGMPVDKAAHIFHIQDNVVSRPFQVHWNKAMAHWAGCTRVVSQSYSVDFHS